MRIITGNPGTGKHTIAKIVSKNLGLEIIDINQIALTKGIVEKKTGEVNVTKLKKIIDKMSSRTSILVGHLAPYVVSPRNVQTAIVLRKSPYSLIETYKKRRYSKKKALENLGSEIIGVIYYDTIVEFGKNKTFQIDTTKYRSPSVAKKVESIFNGGKKKDEYVDWLKLVQKNQHMRRFFPY